MKWLPEGAYLLHSLILIKMKYTRSEDVTHLMIKQQFFPSGYFWLLVNA